MSYVAYILQCCIFFYGLFSFVVSLFLKSISFFKVFTITSFGMIKRNTTWNMQECRFLLTRIFLYKNKSIILSLHRKIRISKNPRLVFSRFLNLRGDLRMLKNLLSSILLSFLLSNGCWNPTILVYKNPYSLIFYAAKVPLTVQ